MLLHIFRGIEVNESSLISDQQPGIDLTNIQLFQQCAHTVHSAPTIVSIQQHRQLGADPVDRIERGQRLQLSVGTGNHGIVFGTETSQMGNGFLAEKRHIDGDGKQPRSLACA